MSRLTATSIGFASTKGQRALPALALLAVAAILLYWLLSPVTFLEMRLGLDGRLLRSIPVAPGERITYSYVHSVQKTPVDEIMEIDSRGHLVVRETVYDMAGAGLPSDLPDGETSVDPATGRFRIAGMSRDMTPWRVRVTFTPGQTLEVRGDRFDLSSLAPPTTLLVVRVATLPRAATLLQ